MSSVLGQARQQLVHTCFFYMLRSTLHESFLCAVNTFYCMFVTEDHSLDQDDLCKPCWALHSNDRFMKVLVQAQDSIQDHTPYKYHGLTSLAKVAHKKEHTIEMFCL